MNLMSLGLNLKDSRLIFSFSFLSPVPSQSYWRLDQDTGKDKRRPGLDIEDPGLTFLGVTIHALGLTFKINFPAVMLGLDDPRLERRYE